MAIDVSEALAAGLIWQPDVSDATYEFLTDLALTEDGAAASARLLRDKRLPLEQAKKLVARHGVSAAELAAFAAREDMPTATLQAWVRKERRVTVLAQIATKPDLPQVVFEMLATRKGVALRKALMFNESAPVDVRAVIAADLLNTDVSDSDKYAAKVALNGSELLQRAVFDRLILNKLDVCGVVSGWQGLSTIQLHAVQDVAETAVADTWTLHTNPTPGRGIGRANMEFRIAANTLWALANHPAADEELLNRIETLVDSYDMPLLSLPRLKLTVASARQRLAAFGGDYASVVSAPHSKLVELADSGVLGSLRLAGLVVTNPLFDTDVAVRMLSSTDRSIPLREITDVLTDWAPDLMSALRIQRAVVPASYSMMDPHIRGASTDELLAALASVADSPVWNRILAVRFAVAGDSDAVTDELVGRFGWFPDDIWRTECRPLGVLVTEFLRRRFGDHVPTWKMFASIADLSTPLVEAAALAVHAEPPPPFSPGLLPAEEVT